MQLSGRHLVGFHRFVELELVRRGTDRPSLGEGYHLDELRE
jgi:hypothetical protein